MRRRSVREIIFVAGEASGDLHAGGVAQALRASRPDLRMVGVGGSHLRECGRGDRQRLRVARGDGIRGGREAYPEARTAAARATRADGERERVAAVVLVDYPGFNMKVGAAAREAGVPVLYYVTPQVWAWGAGRIPKLAKLISKAAVILPFEETLLRGHGIDATFVGHPLLDRATDLPSRAEARARLGIGADERVIALFPGSRAQEIARHLVPFIETGREMKRRYPDARVLVQSAPTVNLGAGDVPFEVARGSSFDLFRAADVALCKSGTTTLESAICECAMAVAYRAGRISYAVARHVVKIPYIGLVNVVAGREVAREFVQGALEPRRVADELSRLMEDDHYREAQRSALIEVRGKLGTPGAASRVAAMLSELAG